MHPTLPSTSTTQPLGSDEELVYQVMTIPVLYLTRNTDGRYPLNQYLLCRGAGARMIPYCFDDMIMNLSIAYTPIGATAVAPLPGHAISQIRIL